MLQHLAKRKYPRFSKNCQVRFKVVELDQMPMEGTTVNISGGGLCFRSDDEMPAGSMLALEIRIPNAPAPVMAMGKLLWQKPLDDGSYENGLEFWWLGWTGEEAEEKNDGKVRKEADETKTE